MASQLCRSGQDSVEGLEEIAKFLGGKFSSALFNVSAQCQLTGKPRADQKLTVSFAEKHLPSWFNCLQSSDGGQLTPEQTFWFRGYAFFVMGVYSGALLHFGYKATPRLQKIGPSLCLVFLLEELDGTWEFSANMQH